MATKTFCVLFALFYSGQCNPLGQTTLCESQSMPNMMSPAGTTVCESTSNLYPSQFPLFSNLALPLPMSMPLPMPMPMPLPMPMPMPMTMPPMPMPMPIPYPPLPFIQQNPVSPTTVCETLPSYGPLMDPTLGGYPFYPRPMSGAGQTTVCESQSNLGVYPRPMPLGTATICDSTSNLLGYPFGIPLRPLQPIVY